MSVAGRAVLIWTDFMYYVGGESENRMIAESTTFDACKRCCLTHGAVRATQAMEHGFSCPFLSTVSVSLGHSCNISCYGYRSLLFPSSARIRCLVLSSACTAAITQPGPPRRPCRPAAGLTNYLVFVCKNKIKLFGFHEQEQSRT